MMWGKLLVLLLVVAGIVTWMRTEGASPDAGELQLAAVHDSISPTDFVAEGIIIRYQSADLPVYYLLYETEGHAFVRKELRFSDARGCNAQAGDLPCVFLGGTDPAPVPIGTYVRVKGEADAQRVMVDTIRIAEDARRDFSIVEVYEHTQGESGGIAIDVDSVYAGGGCEVFLGCFTEDIPRVTFTVLSGRSDRTITMVPGMLEKVPGGAVSLLWADVETGRAVFAIGHGKPR